MKLQLYIGRQDESETDTHTHIKIRSTTSTTYSYHYLLVLVVVNYNNSRPQPAGVRIKKPVPRVIEAARNGRRRRRAAVVVALEGLAGGLQAVQLLCLEAAVAGLQVRPVVVGVGEVVGEDVPGLRLVVTVW